MSIEQFGYGAGGGFISGVMAAILAAMGIRERIKYLENGKLSKDFFLEYHSGVEKGMQIISERMEKMDLKLDMLLKK
jgi:hypothetical protein